MLVLQRSQIQEAPGSHKNSIEKGDNNQSISYDKGKINGQIKSVTSNTIDVNEMHQKRGSGEIVRHSASPDLMII